MKLYEIDITIDKLMDEAVDPETGEINEDVYKRIEALQMEKDNKVEYIGLCIKNDLAESAAIKEEMKKLRRRAEICENRAARSKDFLGYILKGEKFTSARCSVSYRKSKAVDVEPDAWQFLPEQYLRMKQPEPDKKAIGDALKAGQTLPGCKLVENVSMIIK